MRKSVSFKNRDRLVQLGITIATVRRMRGLSQEKLAEKYPECEITMIEGGQPVYYYIISME